MNLADYMKTGNGIALFPFMANVAGGATEFKRAADDHGDISSVTVQELQMVLPELATAEARERFPRSGVLRPVYPIDAAFVSAPADAAAPDDGRADRHL
jgi:hypothetical protein